MAKIQFKVPIGTVPEGTKAGDEFDLVTTYRLEPNGNVCVLIVGDSKMPGYDDKESRKGVMYEDEAQTMAGSQEGGYG